MMSLLVHVANTGPPCPHQANQSAAPDCCIQYVVLAGGIPLPPALRRHWCAVQRSQVQGRGGQGRGGPAGTHAIALLWEHTWRKDCSGAPGAPLTARAEGGPGCKPAWSREPEHGGPSRRAARGAASSARCLPD